MSWLPFLDFPHKILLGVGRDGASTARNKLVASNGLLTETDCRSIEMNELTPARAVSTRSPYPQISLFSPPRGMSAVYGATSLDQSMKLCRRLMEPDRRVDVAPRIMKRESKRDQCNYANDRHHAPRARMALTSLIFFPTYRASLT